MNIIRFCLLAIFLVTFSGCSSVENDIKSFMKCGMAANHLDKSKASRNISRKLEQYIEENNVEGSAREASRLGEEVRDDLGLYEKRLEIQYYTLGKIYNSSTCRDMHEQEKISMPFMYYLTYIFI